MKITTLFLFLFFGFIFAENANSQSAKVSLNKNQVQLEEILDEIENQTNYLFVSNRNVNLSQKVSVNANDKSVKEVLSSVLEDTGLDFKMEGVNIILSERKESQLSQTTPRQQKYISGMVVSTNQETIIGASVIIKGTTLGTTTNVDGEFSLGVPANAVLLISYIGYIPQELQVGNASVYQIVLEEDAKILGEVVVVGYGTVKKSDLTGAISQIKSDDLPQTGNMSLGQMMSGKAPGMQVSVTSAQPGGGVRVQIRGNAAGGAGNPGPLYVVDGYPISTESMEPWSGNQYDSGDKSPLNNLNPADIESIEVLKDAAATAIYGARAANGVVLITTKRGQEGKKPQVQYSGSVSIQKRAKQIEMLNGPNFLNERNRAYYENWLADNRIAPYGSTDPSSITPYVAKYSPEDIANAKTTDWLSAVERDGFITQHNISLKGGAGKSAYYISGNYYDQKGVIKNNGIKRYSGRVNFDQKLGKYIKTGINFNASQVDSDNVAMSREQNERAGVIRAAMTADPTLPIYDEDGNYVLNPDAVFLANPVSLLEINDESVINQLLGNFYLAVNPFKGFDVRMNAGFQQEKGERNTYIPKTTLYGANVGGKAARAYMNRASKLFDVTASYATTIAEKHTLSGMIGYSYQEFTGNGFDAGNSSFITDAFKWNQLQSGEHTKPTVNSWGSEEKLGSVFARLNYNFDNRYLLSATIRGDASSKFAENHKWGYFPSVAVAWRMINEKFMQNQSVISDLKWRVSFGQTGNANIGNNSMALYSTGADYNFGDKSTTGVKQTQLANPNLKWETTTELNIGLDFGLFKNRISGSMEYFKRRVTDLLDNKQLMHYYPISEVMANIGEKESKGFELGINSQNLIGEFKWSTNLIFSLYRDRWVKRNPQWVGAIYEGDKDKLNARYYYLSDGLIQPSDMNPDGTCSIPHMPNAKPGMIKYKDVNGRDAVDGSLVNKPDGKLDDADIIYKGTSNPDYYFGLGNTFTYKGFDLNIFFYGYFGRQMENPAYDWYLNNSSTLATPGGGNLASKVKDRWSHDNPTGKYPNSMQNPYGRSSDFWLENADFLRCKNITLGYTLPRNEKLNKVIQNLRVYADIQNPFVITGYSGVDPEMDAMAAYPTQLTISFGIDITF